MKIKPMTMTEEARERIARNSISGHLREVLVAIKSAAGDKKVPVEAHAAMDKAQGWADDAEIDELHVELRRIRSDLHKWDFVETERMIKEFMEK